MKLGKYTEVLASFQVFNNTMAAEWLKQRYYEVSSEGPPEKRVKYTTIKEELERQFPTVPFNDRKVSQAITQAFPNSQSRKSGSAHNRYIYGIEPTAADVSAEDTDNPLALENKQLQKQVEELQRRVQELELQHSRVQQNLDEQMQCLLYTSNAVLHGPDTLEHISNFLHRQHNLGVANKGTRYSSPFPNAGQV